jgi:hypothetical protein
MSNTLTMYLDPFKMEGQQRADWTEALTVLYAGRDPAEIPNVKGLSPTKSDASYRAQKLQRVNPGLAFEH